MYSAKKIQATLDAFEKSEGWMPVYHTLDEVNEFKAYIDSTVAIESNSKSSWISKVKPLSTKRQEEVLRWIQNEQALCAIDSGYFDRNYVYITDECGQVIKFQNRKSQEVIDSVIADLEESDSAIELIIMGTRQTGIATKVMNKFLHRALFVPYTQLIVASVTHEKTRRHEEFFDSAYNKLPWWLVPMRMPKKSFSNGARTVLQSGMQTQGIAQGLTPSCIYLSNVDLFPNAHKVIEEGLLRAVHSSRNTFLVLHGNKETNTGWFNDAYRSAKEYWPQGKSRLRPVFIPWPICSDIYPQKDWLRCHPVPAKWRPTYETIDHMNRCAKFITSTPYIAKIAGNEWSMPIEQQWYWETQYVQSKLRGSLESFEKMFSPDDVVPTEERKVN